MDIPLELVMCHRILDWHLHLWLHLASLHMTDLITNHKDWRIWSEVAGCYIHVFKRIDTQFPSILKLALAFCVEVVEWEALKHNPQVEWFPESETLPPNTPPPYKKFEEWNFHLCLWRCQANAWVNWRLQYLDQNESSQGSQLRLLLSQNLG